VSAARAKGVCPAAGRSKVRYRNRLGAMKGLDRGRQAARKAGRPEPLWPTDIYRCLPRDRGGCNGWHLSIDRRAAEEYLAGLPAGEVITLPSPPPDLDAAALAA
jgi:hypothetical protein